MLFNSDIFLLVFLPLVVVAHYGVRHYRGRWAGLVVLLVASLVFYGWWDPRYLPLLLLSIGVNYALANRLADRPSRRILGFGVAFNLALIGVFKYADFFLGSLAALGGRDYSALAIILPLGISFFTFQQIAMLVDCHKGLERPSNLVSYALFVSFFPQLIAGPIVHHGMIVPQFHKPLPEGAMARNLAIGATIFIIGLVKKVLIADSLAPYASSAFAAADGGAALDFGTAWGGVLAYTFQIYFDFSGYSDMALGLGRLFGYQIPVNFNSPYKSASIIEFWRRWHITLSHFLRDYLYIPLGGGRRGPSRALVNVMIVMLLGGLWHGAAWTFVLWGGLHGAYLVVNHLWRRTGRALPRWLALPLTFLAVAVAWVFFRAETFPGAFAMLAAMTGWGEATASFDPDLFGGLAVALVFVWLAPNTAQVFARQQDPDALRVAGVRPSDREVLHWRPRPALALAAGLLLLVVISNLWKSSEFIYFQF